MINLVHDHQGRIPPSKGSPKQSKAPTTNPKRSSSSSLMSDDKKKQHDSSTTTKYAKLVYHHLLTHLLPSLILLPISTTIVVAGARMLLPVPTHHQLALIAAASGTATLFVIWWRRHATPIYLVDFSCYKPDDSFKHTCESFVERSVALGVFTDDNVLFQKKILEHSGLGGSTYFPKAVATIPPDIRLVQARNEAELVVFGAIDDLLARTDIAADDIAVVVSNCSLFCPTPSLAEMVVRRYRVREDVACYHLSGMGCSAGIIAVDLAANLLRSPAARRRRRRSCCYALVVSTENLTQHGYYGNDRSMLVTNCLFRMGGAAVLLSGGGGGGGGAKYRLSAIVRTHRGAEGGSYRCVTQGEDGDGKVGVSLSKDLMSVAGDALRANITKLGPRVLPVSEQLLFAASAAARRVLPRALAVPQYVPDFRLAFNHFCIHAGRRAVLDELEKRLRLREWHMEPSRMTLYRFGNTSSSSLWYELAYSEAKGRIKKGDRVWQIGFGSGFKCNSAVWTATRDVSPEETRQPWTEEIDEFPVDVPKVNPISMNLVEQLIMGRATCMQGHA